MVPAIGMSVCDVRDVAAAHVKALETPDVIFILCGSLSVTHVQFCTPRLEVATSLILEVP